MGRFLNADTIDYIDPESINGINLYAYALNNPVQYCDPSGHFWLGTLIGAAVGAIGGFIGQIVSDAVTSLENGKITISNWQTYTGAVVGGAAAGAVLAMTGNVNLSNTVLGAVTTFVGQGLEKLTIAGYNKSWQEIALNSVADGLISGALGRIKGLKGVSSGRNSFSAVYKSGLTKLRNSTARRMSVKVLSKGLASNLISGLPLDLYYGTKQHAYDRVKELVL